MISNLHCYGPEHRITTEQLQRPPTAPWPSAFYKISPTMVSQIFLNCLLSYRHGPARAQERQKTDQAHWLKSNRTGLNGDWENSVDYYCRAVSVVAAENATISPPKDWQSGTKMPIKAEPRHTDGRWVKRPTLRQLKSLGRTIFHFIFLPKRLFLSMFLGK